LALSGLRRARLRFICFGALVLNTSRRVDLRHTGLQDAKLKIEQPKLCSVGLAAAAADCTPPGEESYPKPKWVGDEYRHDIGELKIRISRADYDWAKAQWDRAVRLEKDRIRPDVDAIAKDSGGIRVQGHETKELESYLRKFFSERTDKNGNVVPLEQVATKMNDAVRYTYLFPAETYADKVKAVRDLFKASDYALVRLKNFWTRDGLYPGINVTFASKDGQLFELQFHTRNSYDAKMKEGKIYERRRALEAQIDAIEGRAAAEKRPLTDAETREVARLRAEKLEEEGRSEAIFDDVETPPQVEEIEEI